MKTHPLSPRILLVGIAAAFAVAQAAADVVETTDGGRLVGNVKSIAGGKIVISTASAGDVTVNSSAVASITVDSPRFVRLGSGSVAQGTLSGPAASIKITGGEGQTTAALDQIVGTWAPGGVDPEVAKLQRKWSYQATVDITGKSGNSDQLGTAVGLHATLTGPQDTLKLYTDYNRQKSDSVISADQFRAGIDYANNFSGDLSWYVRDEGGYDHVKDIRIYNTAAAGFGYDMIKNDKQTLTTRLGVAYRFEGYKTAGRDDLSSAGADVAINHSYKFSNAKMVNSITFVPAFDDLSDFRLVHDSAFEMPITASLWTLRIGINNDYTSKTAVGVKKLDTTYYTRLVLSWE